MWEKADQNNFEYGHFLRSAKLGRIQAILHLLYHAGNNKVATMVPVKA